MNKRLLIVNVFFAPRSFGGATIVAEEVSKRLKSDHGWKISAFTTMNEASMPDYSIRRYKSKSIDTYAVNLVINLSYLLTYRNLEMAVAFAKIVKAVDPDVVHVHSIQTIGCEIFEVLVKNSIPFAVTVHDCWWICERQFMTHNSGQYCFQNKISLDVCRYCVHDFKKNESRFQYLKEQLATANLLFFPSEFQRNLYISNGFDPSKTLINKNGIKFPQTSYKKYPPCKKFSVRFAFVGGPGWVKGADLIVNAFNSIPRKDYLLKVVDASKTINRSWVDYSYWTIPGKIEFVPPYNQGTIDDFFNSVDVLLFPSQCKEAFGLTVREALVRDVWVVATDAGGVSEDLKPGENAAVIPMDGDYQKLQREIEACFDINWQEYENKYKADIRSFDEQAEELSGFLGELT